MFDYCRFAQPNEKGERICPYAAVRPSTEERYCGFVLKKMETLSACPKKEKAQRQK